nr:hypothetical protein [Clostridium aestuarii]
MIRLPVFKITNLPTYFSGLQINYIDSKEIQINVKCPICGECHNYTYNIVEFIKGTMIIGGCEKIGLPIFFIGNTEKVEQKINKYKEVNEKIHAMI